MCIRDSRRGRARGSGSRATNHQPWYVALLWLGPALALILGVVLFPAIKLVEASMGRLSLIHI